MIQHRIKFSNDVPIRPNQILYSYLHAFLHRLQFISDNFEVRPEKRIFIPTVLDCVRHIFAHSTQFRQFRSKRHMICVDTPMYDLYNGKVD